MGKIVARAARFTGLLPLLLLRSRIRRVSRRRRRRRGLGRRHVALVHERCCRAAIPTVEFFGDATACDRRLGVAVGLVWLALARGRGASVGDRPTAPDLVGHLPHPRRNKTRVQKTTRAIDNMGFSLAAAPLLHGVRHVQHLAVEAATTGAMGGSLSPVRAPHCCAMATVLAPSFASDYFNIFAVLSTAGAAGYTLGERTKIGNALSGPVCAMVITFFLTSTGVLPPASPLVSRAQLMAVQLATPLLLLSADMRAVGRRAGRLVPSFLLGTLGTVLGALLGVQLFGGALAAAFGADGIKACMALAAKNIGGGLNFVAVAAALKLSPTAFAAALAVDNVMALAYFPLCSWLGRGEADPCGEDDAGCVLEDGSVAGGAVSMDEDRVGAQGKALAVALSIAATSRALAERFAPGLDLPLSTALAVAAATLAPGLFGPLAGVGTDMGTTCVFLFFATAGWTGGARLARRSSLVVRRSSASCARSMPRIWAWCLGLVPPRAGSGAARRAGSGSPPSRSSSSPPTPTSVAPPRRARWR